MKPWIAIACLAAGMTLLCCGPEDSTRTPPIPDAGRAQTPLRTPAGSGPRIQDLNQYIAFMEAPQRAAWQQPAKVVKALALRAGEHVADVGCGPGYFTLPVARAVGPEGKVWAVDIEPKMLERLREHAREARISNIQFVRALPDDPELPANQIDTVLIVNTYHHFPERRAYVKKLLPALRPGGRIVIIDFIPTPRSIRGFGPPLTMQSSKEAVDEEMAAAGLFPAVVHSFLNEQYFVEYKIKGQGAFD